MYKIIRSGTGFALVILVSPPDATPEMPDAKYYRYASWQIGGDKPFVFNEIHQDCALGYFGGIADGIGFESPPEEIFPSLDSALDFVKEKNLAWDKKWREEVKQRHQRDVGLKQCPAARKTLPEKA